MTDTHLYCTLSTRSPKFSEHLLLSATLYNSRSLEHPSPSPVAFSVFFWDISSLVLCKDNKRPLGKAFTSDLKPKEAGSSLSKRGVFPLSSTRRLSFLSQAQSFQRTFQGIRPSLQWRAAKLSWWEWRAGQLCYSSVFPPAPFTKLWEVFV